jgi:hypothetical protein
MPGDDEKKQWTDGAARRETERTLLPEAVQRPSRLSTIFMRSRVNEPRERQCVIRGGIEQQIDGEVLLSLGLIMGSIMMRAPVTSAADCPC